MWRWTTRILIGLCAGVLVVACCGGAYEWISTRKELAATPPPGRLVDVGGHRLHLWCTGAGEPAVILESGLGGSTAGWGFVQPEVARFTRVCSYDRAGLGYSDPGPSPRTARRSARELEQLLDRSGMAGSFVLVGASSGGFTARLFASERSERVAGLVLVDASHEDQAHEIPGIAPFVAFLSSVGVLRVLGVSFSLPPESLAPPVRGFARATEFRAAGYRAAADEILHIRESAAEVRSARRLLTMPVVIVTGARGSDATWRQLQRDQVGLSQRGCQIVADQSGHVVQLEQPEVVVEAIRAIVDAARGRKNVPLCARTGAD